MNGKNLANVILGSPPPQKKSVRKNNKLLFACDRKRDLGIYGQSHLYRLMNGYYPHNRVTLHKKGVSNIFIIFHQKGTWVYFHPSTNHYCPLDRVFQMHLCRRKGVSNIRVTLHQSVNLLSTNQHTLRKTFSFFPFCF